MLLNRESGTAGPTPRVPGSRVLGLIPARGGSKGIPRKNARDLLGKPLLAYTADAARAATRLTRVVLTTDDEEIAALGRALGLEVPFRRPAELARDDTPMVPVVAHALRALAAAGDAFDAVCLLQPTSPLRRAADIDACVALLDDPRVDAAVTVLPVPHEHNPHWVFEPDGDGFLRLATGEAEPIPRRQALPPAFHRDGAVYVARSALVLERGTLLGGRLRGHPTDPRRHVNLDTPDDWTRAESLLVAERGIG